MGLFKPAWMSKDELKAEEAVQRVKSQELLAQIAKDETITNSARIVATNMLNNQNDLKFLAEYSSCIYVSADAMKKIDKRDQDFILKMALSGSMDVRKEAIKLLENYEGLVSIINSELPKFGGYSGGSSNQLAGYALHRIMLLSIPLSEKKKALDLFKIDKSKLDSTIKVDVPENLYAELGIEIEEKRYFTEEGHTYGVQRVYYNREDKIFNAQYEDIKNIDDQSTLAEIAIRGGGSLERSEALAKLTDLALISKVAEQSIDINIRNNAANRYSHLHKNNS